MVYLADSGAHKARRMRWRLFGAWMLARVTVNRRFRRFGMSTELADRPVSGALAVERTKIGLAHQPGRGVCYTSLPPHAGQEAPEGRRRSPGWLRTTPGSSEAGSRPPARGSRRAAAPTRSSRPAPPRGRGTWSARRSRCAWINSNAERTRPVLVYVDSGIALRCYVEDA